MFWSKKPTPPKCLSCQLHEQSLRWGNDNAEYKKQREVEREKSARKAEKRESARLAGIEKQKSKQQKPQASDTEFRNKFDPCEFCGNCIMSLMDNPARCIGLKGCRKTASKLTQASDEVV